jgi:hypothetical protein
VHAALVKYLPGVRVERHPGGCMLHDAADKPAARVMARPDGEWQISGIWGWLPFATFAPITARAADVVRSATAGAIRFLREPYTPELRRELQPRLDGLGVDLLRWLRERGPRPPS